MKFNELQVGKVFQSKSTYGGWSSTFVKVREFANNERGELCNAALVQANSIEFFRIRDNPDVREPQNEADFDALVNRVTMRFREGPIAATANVQMANNVVIDWGQVAPMAAVQDHVLDNDDDDDGDDGGDGDNDDYEDDEDGWEWEDDEADEEPEENEDRF